MKRIFFLLLAAAMFSCSSNNNKNTSGDNAKPADNTTEAKQPEAPAADKPAARKSNMPVLVLANRDGSKFLLRSDAATANAPDSLSHYKFVAYEGKTYPVKFNGYQAGNPDASNDRDNFYNFDNIKGYVFQMQSGSLLPDAENDEVGFWGVPLLIDAQDEKNVVPFEKLPSDIPPYIMDENKEFAGHYGRELEQFTVDATFDNCEGSLCNFFVMQYKPKDGKALAAICLASRYDEGWNSFYKDFPADWDESSTWKVDDMGEFMFGLIHVMCKDGALTLYTAHTGGESTSFQTYVTKGEALVEGSYSDEFYQAPE
ncbi:MAG: hypothetical protein K6F33_02185 [Bacteroidales bacterium]|nr:hypothetical protein [Bacteroidales bacterium]